MLSSVTYQIFSSLTERAALEEMKRLREKLPSGSALLALQNFNVLGDKLGRSMSSQLFYELLKNLAVDFFILQFKSYNY